MKTKTRLSNYKGLPITVRWTEVERGLDSWGPRGHQFVASYLIGARGAESATWQHCSPHVFLSFRAAAAHALAQAQHAVDAGVEQRAA
jgi:hypothetical protein